MPTVRWVWNQLSKEDQIEWVSADAAAKIADEDPNVSDASIKSVQTELLYTVSIDYDLSGIEIKLRSPTMPRQEKKSIYDLRGVYRLTSYQNSRMCSDFAMLWSVFTNNAR